MNNKNPYEVLDLKALRCFFYVAKTGSVTRAALELGIAGPAVTQRVQQLEKDLGVKLYETRGGRVKLTASGERTRAFAISVFAEIDEFERSLTQSEESAEIVLTAHDSYLGYLLPAGLEEFKRQHPQARIRLLARRIDEIIRLLKDNEADVGVLPQQELPKELFFRAIATYPTMFLAPKGHPLVRQARADFRSILNKETLSSHPVIVAEVQLDRYEETFAALKLPLAHRHGGRFAGNREALRRPWPRRCGGARALPDARRSPAHRGHSRSERNQPERPTAWSCGATSTAARCSSTCSGFSARRRSRLAPGSPERC
jgi:DNA-binding transcriptional LysR family regulator